MILNQLMLGINHPQSSLVKVYATLDPLSIGANVTLSNNNLTYQSNNYRSARAKATISKSNGKHYWEISVAAPGNSQGPLYLGVGSSNLDDYSYVYASIVGKFYINGGKVDQKEGYVAGNIVGIALDMDNHEVSFYKNGIFIKTLTGLTNTSVTPLTYIGYISTCICTYNFGATEFIYTPPVGYNAGLYTNS